MSSIGKVVWSCFDFMCGPELKFVWEVTIKLSSTFGLKLTSSLQVTSSSSVSPVNLSGEEGSVNDAESLDSSMTTQSAQYEDIDDPLEVSGRLLRGASLVGNCLNDSQQRERGIAQEESPSFK